jgi:capsule synthesis protein PGA_cap
MGDAARGERRRLLLRFAVWIVLPAASLPLRALAQEPEPAEPAAAPAAQRPTRLCAGGDVTFGTNLDTAWSRKAAQRLRAQFGLSAQPESFVAPLRPLFADADVVLLNVETAIGTGPAEPKCTKRSRNCYAFRGAPSAAPAFRSVGDSGAVVVGNVANNHARDAGGIGVDSTIAHLTRARVLVTGADTLATPVLLPDGKLLAVLGFYTSTETPDVRDLAGVRRHVARAVEMYGTVIVTAHLGAEGITAQRTRDSTEYFLESKIDRGNPVAFANAALDAGAAVVIGHGPHVLRAAEWRDDRLVLYSLGNLATYGPFNLIEPLNRGVVACVDLEGRQVVGAELRPTVQLAPGIVQRDAYRRALKLVDSLSTLDFPLTGARVDSWGELRRPSPRD